MNSNTRNAFRELCQTLMDTAVSLSSVLGTDDAGKLIEKAGNLSDALAKDETIIGDL
jgi:hypothetical protein